LIAFSVKKSSSKESWKIRGIIITVVGIGLISMYISPYKLFYKLVFERGYAVTDDSYCVLLDATDIPCPFCGLSRGFLQFLDFNFTNSLYYNPSSVVLFFSGGIVLLVVFVLSFFNFKIVIKNEAKLWYIIFLILGIIWILNIFWGHH
jgi:hypothetical protein